MLLSRHTRRREFIAGVGAAAWPLVAVAQQQSERLRRVSVLIPRDQEGDPDYQARVAAFVQALSDLGWIDGRNLRLDIRRPAPISADIRKHIAELVATVPDVIVSYGGTITAPLVQATRTVPIVFTAVVDPVGGGYVESLAYPGGNATGFMQSDYGLSAKWLELLKQMSPTIRRVAVIRDPAASSGIAQFAVIQSVAPAVGIDVVPINVRDASEIERAVENFVRIPNGGLIEASGASVSAHRDLIIALAARHRLPAIYPRRVFVDRGGLMSYGPNVLVLSQLAAGYVDRILKGAKPADLPVQAPIKYELVINLKTAKALGLDVPPTLLARADEVIE
jgi:putative ABC transport system substrate-binding protein